MKSKPANAAARRALLKSVIAALLPATIGSVALKARADLPAPDNLLYGSVTLGGQLMTAANTNVITELHTTLTGPAVNTYRLGSDRVAGNFYLLKVTLEERAPRAAQVASLVGDTVFIVVRDDTGPRATNSFLITERGVVARRDFGTTPSGDADGDGLPDAWELAVFGNLSRNAEFVAANGQTARQNYVAGTDPNNPNDRFILAISNGAPNKVISYFARAASGPGYAGLSRRYALEYTTNAAGPWQGVANQTNIIGGNNTISYPTTESETAIFYRGEVYLQSP